MDDILEFDMNKIIKDEVKSILKSYADKLKESRDENRELIKEISKLKEEMKYVNHIKFLSDYTKKVFSKVKDDNEKFLFIENIMKNIFGINVEHKGLVGESKYYGTLKQLLAINYYKNKEFIINLLKILDVKSDVISFINNFKMPYDYSKEDVIEYVKQPKINTNGCIFGISKYWIEYGAGKSNMPHDLIMKNPYILEDDVFDMLIKSIKNGVGRSYFLFALPEYNKNISDDQIRLLGACLITLNKSLFDYDVVKNFIRKNMHKFDVDTLNYLFGLITHDNQFEIFHWEHFPVIYQMKYLKSKSFEEVYKIINNYSCKWTIGEKERFLKLFLKI